MIYYKHDLVLIYNDGLSIPIEIMAPTLELTHEEFGVFSVSGGAMRSVSGIPVTGASLQVDTYNNRPTLFVSIGGAKGLDVETGNIDLRKGDGIGDWQRREGTTRDLTSKIINAVGADHQYAYMFVDWYSSRQIRPQVKDLARYIKQFLGKRAQKWDVAVVGHSRGGILAHELSK
jgi:pimeloyl-ACP methyl ester carboxylesterase